VWNSDTGEHRLRSCCVCPAIPAKDTPPDGTLCKRLDDVLTCLWESDSVSLTDMLLMTGDASPTPGFIMLVQYVASLCHLHSIPTVQLQFKLHNQQTLDVSQAHVLAYGHKSMVVQLGVEDAVYKVHSTHAVMPVVCACINFLSLFVEFFVICYGATQPFSSQACGWQVTHEKLIQNEVMIHNKVDATVPFILKCHLDVFGSVEGAGAGWGFLKLQHRGRSLRSVPLNQLPHFWSCAFQVHRDQCCFAHMCSESTNCFGMAGVLPSAKLVLPVR